MIHVVLDTNIYRNNPSRNNLNFKAIERLANSNLVKLHIPYVVEREFQTQQREIYSQDLSKVLSGLSALTRKQLSIDILRKLNSLKDELDAESNHILSDAEDQLVQWSENIGANRYPLCLDQAHTALEAYFQGSPPLITAKVREDIPDSFIVQAINKLHANNGLMHVVAGDKKVRASFSDIETIVTHESLSEFIESDVVQNELKDLDLLDNIEVINSAIQNYENDFGEISYKIDHDIGEEIIWGMIGDSSIHDDNNEATINGYYEAEDIELDFTELAYYGNGQFGIPFGLRIMVSAVYYIFKSEYYSMDASREPVPSVTDHNDHYFEAEDDFDVVVNGMASISIDRDNIDFDEFSECVDDASIGIDSVESIVLS